MLTSARAAVRRGDATGARSMLDAHARGFPRSRFGEEAAVLRIETLALGGDQEEARRAIRQFLADHPGSAYAARVQSLYR
jgi:outer membrane protein assembly factor BamD (BamD/ComL family)